MSSIKTIKITNEIKHAPASILSDHCNAGYNKYITKTKTVLKSNKYCDTTTDFIRSLLIKRLFQKLYTIINLVVALQLTQRKVSEARIARNCRGFLLGAFRLPRFMLCAGFSCHPNAVTKQ